MALDRFKGGEVPVHIGIIMDGNGRWAKKRGLPRKFGHREGAKTFRKITKHAKKIGIKYLTLYAFSTENWKRPKDEVDAIMELFDKYNGELPFTDKASPELIKRETGMSKNEFKRAIGNLLKNNKVEIKSDSIKRTV